ncbi:MAG: hypothetical protein GWP91_18550 [Rhodobacterales bacterium]|nr:hypothetical protein [Rhodobacterales bacterium]
MLNLLIAFSLGAVVYSAVGFTLGPWAAVVPTVLVWLIAAFLLARRTGAQVEVEMAGLTGLLQGGQIAEAKALLEEIRAKYAYWQILLNSSIDAQLGILEYLQMQWDAALPLLEKGRSNNWTAVTCIACIYYRRGLKEKAWKEFESAQTTAPKEALVYMIHATLRVRSGMRKEALDSLAAGLIALPESDVLKRLQKTVANKKKINTKKFPENWYQFFPEELMTQHMMRGRRDGKTPWQGQGTPARPSAKAIYRQ